MDATWKTRTARGCCRLWRRVHLDAGAVRAHGVAAWRHLEAPGGEAGRLTVAGGVGFSQSTALLAIPLGPIEIFPKAPTEQQDGHEPIREYSMLVPTILFTSASESGVVGTIRGRLLMSQTGKRPNHCDRYSVNRYNDTHAYNQPEPGSLCPLTSRYSDNKRKPR
jgi:hypothetical protein